MKKRRDDNNSRRNSNKRRRSNNKNNAASNDVSTIMEDQSDNGESSSQSSKQTNNSKQRNPLEYDDKEWFQLVKSSHKKVVGKRCKQRDELLKSSLEESRDRVLQLQKEIIRRNKMASDTGGECDVTHEKDDNCGMVNYGGYLQIGMDHFSNLPIIGDRETNHTDKEQEHKNQNQQPIIFPRMPTIDDVDNSISSYASGNASDDDTAGLEMNELFCQPCSNQTTEANYVTSAASATMPSSKQYSLRKRNTTPRSPYIDTTITATAPTYAIKFRDDKTRKWNETMHYKPIQFCEGIGPERTKFPLSTTTVFLKSLFGAEDMQDLMYVPYFDDNSDSEEIISEHFDTKQREKLMEDGPLYMKKEVDDTIDECLECALLAYDDSKNDHDRDDDCEMKKLFKRRLFYHLSDVMDISTGRVIERYHLNYVDADATTDGDDLNSASQGSGRSSSSDNATESCVSSISAPVYGTIQSTNDFCGIYSDNNDKDKNSLDATTESAVESDKTSKDNNDDEEEEDIFPGGNSESITNAIERVKTYGDKYTDVEKSCMLYSKCVMDSYRNLFCRRCFTYDCNIHGNLTQADIELQTELACAKGIEGKWEDCTKLSVVGNAIDNEVTASAENENETSKPQEDSQPKISSSPPTTVDIQEPLPQDDSQPSISSPPSTTTATTDIQEPQDDSQSKIPSPPPTTTTTTTTTVVIQELSTLQKTILDHSFQIFGGKLEDIASALGCPLDSLKAHIEKNPIEVRKPKYVIPKPEISFVSKKKKRKLSDKKSMRQYNAKWLKRVQDTQIHPAFDPCTHTGPCSRETCSCVQDAFFCTKHCVWGEKSTNFFRGCACKAGQCRTMVCPCFAAKRECDPDLCKTCGACTDPPNSVATTQRCRNDNISMRRHCHLLLAESRIPGAGWGIFTKQALKRGDFVHEYIGEVISQEEAERRGVIYDKENRSYLFNLNSDYVVDARRKGNKTKFANHSSEPNCYSRIVSVNGDNRIGLYAKEDIKAQSELFFDYRYDVDLKDDLLVKPSKVVDWMKKKSAVKKKDI